MDDGSSGRADRRVEGECWLNTRWKPRADGYVYATLDGKQGLLHRTAWESVHGLVPEGLVLDHLCRNRACHRPSHLEAVTRAVNNRRGLGGRGGRQDFDICQRGHDLRQGYITVLGTRRCRECTLAANRLSRQRKIQKERV